MAESSHSLLSIYSRKAVAVLIKKRPADIHVGGPILQDELQLSVLRLSRLQLSGATTPMSVKSESTSPRNQSPVARSGADQQ